MSKHTHRIPESKRRQQSRKIDEILRNVPYEKGFHFYTAQGAFTGETATSLDTFEKKLQLVPADSISFHVQRGDFQKWIEDTLADGELARRVSIIKATLPAEDLRKDLLDILQTRLTELRQQLPHHMRHSHA